MKLPSSISKILTNKYFLYFVTFLSITNVLGYIMMKKTDTAILFVLIALIMSKFSKNMSIVLLVPLIIVNFFMAGMKIKEGLENRESRVDSRRASHDLSGNQTSEESTEETTEVDKDIDQAKEKIQEIQANQQAIKDKLNELKDKVKAKKEEKQGSSSTEETSEPESFEVGAKGRKGSSRIDYGTTIENAYDDLNKIIGSDGIKKLTEDSQKLMNQQMKLAEAMNNMGPLVQSAKDMLKGFDLSNLSGLAGVK
jgi:uncharacterized protein YktA (UPF0223 family)